MIGHLLRVKLVLHHLLVGILLLLLLIVVVVVVEALVLVEVLIVVIEILRRTLLKRSIANRGSVIRSTRFVLGLGTLDLELYKGKSDSDCDRNGG